MLREDAKPGKINYSHYRKYYSLFIPGRSSGEEEGAAAGEAEVSVRNVLREK